MTANWPPKLPWRYRWPLRFFWKGYLAWEATRWDVPVWQKQIEVVIGGMVVPQRYVEQIWLRLYAKRNYRRSAWVLSLTLVMLSCL